MGLFLECAMYKKILMTMIGILANKENAAIATRAKDDDYTITPPHVKSGRGKRKAWK